MVARSAMEMRRQTDDLDAMKLGLPSPAKIHGMRTKRNLSQREAGPLLKVGENAFCKYERGLIEPSGPTMGQLLRILDRYAEMVDE
jgi:HTH-type transcriptional regulator/antitoxin MqsA